MATTKPQVRVNLSAPPSLSLSDPKSFSITVSAHTATQGSQTLTIYHPETLLDPQYLAFDEKGFTFTDSKSTERIHRPCLDVLREYPQDARRVSLATVDNFVELSPSYTTTFHMSEEPLLGQTNGFVIGREYRVGLGEDGKGIVWWRIGAKLDVLREGEKRNEVVPLVSTEQLEMVLGDEVTFVVVE